MKPGTTWAQERRAFIGGSDARIIMGNDEAAVLRLWREKRGDAEPEDLSGNLAVQLGVATEALNRHWYERNTGQVVTAVQRRVQHPVIRFRGRHVGRHGRGDGGGVRNPNSCSRGPFPKKLRHKNTSPKSSTICGSPTPERPCSRSSPAAASGSNLPSRLIRSTSIFCSRRRKSSGAVWNRASPLACFGPNRPKFGLSASALLT